MTLRGQDPRLVLAWIAVLALGVGAASVGALAGLRPPPPDRRGSVDMRVTSAADGGPGSLREAIFAADRAAGRARILLDVPVRVLTPLPPLVNPAGIVVEGNGVVDARELAVGPVLDIASPRSVVHGIRFVGGAGAAVLVRAAEVHVEEAIFDSVDTGVHVAAGSATVQARFVGAGIGVAVDPRAHAVVERSVFERSGRAAVWAAGPLAEARTAATALHVRDSDVSGGPVGVLAANVPARVERTRFAGCTDAAVHIEGTGTVVRANRIRSGRHGVVATSSIGARIEDNEVDHNTGVGVLLRDGAQTAVVRNRVYANGYGIVVVFGDPARPHVVAYNLVLDQLNDGLYVIGGGPILRANEVRASRSAGLRVHDFARSGRAPRVALPLVQGNTIAGNGLDSTQTGVYVERE